MKTTKVGKSKKVFTATKPASPSRTAKPWQAAIPFGNVNEDALARASTASFRVKRFCELMGLEEIYEYGEIGSLVMNQAGDVSFVQRDESKWNLTLSESVRWHSILSIVSGGFGGTCDALHRWHEAIATALAQSNN